MATPKRVNKAGKKIPDSRSKGHVWERKFAELVRAAFPELDSETRRSQQGAGAIEPDVIWHPGLWTELQASAKPTPLKKLEQATDDLNTWVAMYSDVSHDIRMTRVPVAIIKDTKRHKITAHFWLRDLNAAVFPCPRDILTTVSLEDFFVLVHVGSIG